MPDALCWRGRFAPSTERFANPDRGFSRFTQTSLGPDHVPLDAADLAADRAESGITIVFRYVYLERYRRQATIADEDLERLGDDLDAVRRAGVSLVVRFAYSETSGRDAAVGRVVGHVRQLVPVVNAAADAVLALQAGFVGRWGEWYFSDHFASSKRRPWIVTEADSRRRRQVLEALLQEAPDLQLQVRYPAIVRNLAAGLDADRARVGVHNDGFLASADDLGTYRAPDDRDWLEAQSARALVGGETCAVAPPYSDWDNAAAELERFHWTYLNADFDTRVLESWGTAGRNEVAQRLGHRLRLTAGSAHVLDAPGVGGDGDGPVRARVELELVNDGWAAPVKAWQAHLLVIAGGAVEAHLLEGDPRTWLPGRTVRLAADVDLPGPGPHDLALALLPAGQQPVEVDGPGALRAIRLANDGVWDAERGWNRLGTTTPAR